MDLALLLSNSNAARLHAEQQYASLKSDPAGLLRFLFSVVAHAVTPEQQQSGASATAMTLACVLLRGMAIRERQLFASLSAEEFAHCRALLLGALSSMWVPVHVRLMLCNTTAAVAGLDSNWPELIYYIQTQLTGPNSPDSRVCLFLLEKLAEHVGRLLVSNLEPVLQWIDRFLGEAVALDGATRSAAALALFSLLYEIPTSLADSVAVPLEHGLSVIRLNIETGEDTLASDLLTAVLKLSEERPWAFRGVWRQLLDLTVLLCQAPADSDKVDSDMKVSALQIATNMLTNSQSAALCSTPETRAAFLNIAMSFTASVEEEYDSNFFFRRNEDDGAMGDVLDEDLGMDMLSPTGAECLHAMACSFD